LESDDEKPHGNRSVKKKPRKASSAAKSVNFRWALIMLGWTCLISMTLSFLASNALEHIGYILAFLLLGAFILLGVLFDIVGISVASASEKPFHSMASRKVDGAFEALIMVRNAEKVSSFCNDVVGDIAGIISGTTSAVIVTRMSGSLSVNTVVLQLVFPGIVAGLTVGGKAIGKSLALNFNTNIVFYVGRALYFFKHVKDRIFKK
jgi:hypothetical protein